MKFLILTSLLFSQLVFARPPAEQCFEQLTCTGRVHRFDNQVATHSDQDLFTSYFAVEFGRIPPLSELQIQYVSRLHDFEAMCNTERLRRSTFGPDPWGEDSKLTFMKPDIKCWPLISAGGACRIPGQACEVDTDCCPNSGLQRCDATLGVCKTPPRIVILPNPDR